MSILRVRNFGYRLLCLLAGIRDGAAAYFDHVNKQGGVAWRKIRFIALDEIGGRQNP